jgi:hypothetical protein
MSMYDKLRRDIRISRGYTDSNNWVPDWASKVKKLLYVNGCSHTAGTEIAMKYRLDLTWPNLLAKHLDYNLIDESECGKSNDNIFRTTIEYVLSSSIPPDKVVIQFTDVERFEINKKGMNPRSKDPGIEKYLPFIEDYFELNVNKREISTEYSHKLINQIYSLENIFKEHAIEDYTFLIWRKIDENYITYKFINKSKIILNVALKLSQKYKTCGMINIDNHFGQDAHEEIFEWLKYGKDWYGKITKAEEITDDLY